MKYRKAVFVVTYAMDKGEILYVLLKRKLHWKGWEFPKGGAEKGESSMTTVKRELFEETGLRSRKIKRFSVKGKYRYNKKFPDRPGYLGQTYQLFSAEVKKGKLKIDKKEHSTYKWLPFDEAVKKLKWQSQKKCFRVVNRFLIGKE